MKAHGEKLSRKQELAIAALLTCHAITDAAHQCGIGEVTLHRWLKEAPFRPPTARPAVRWCSMPSSRCSGHWGSGGDLTQRHAGPPRPRPAPSECGQDDPRHGHQSDRTRRPRATYRGSRNAARNHAMSRLATRVARLEHHLRMGESAKRSCVGSVLMASLRTCPTISPALCR